jgi:hypothetical protein
MKSSFDETVGFTLLSLTQEKKNFRIQNLRFQSAPFCVNLSEGLLWSGCYPHAREKKLPHPESALSICAFLRKSVRRTPLERLKK